MSFEPSNSSSFENDVKDFFESRTLGALDVFFYKTTDSTNTRAKLYAENRDKDDRRPAIFFSHAQCAGRGTRGRTFESPAGGGVYISYLLYPERGACDSLALTTYAAVSVCRAIRRVSGRIAPKIKWVNDITLDDRKLSGILTEGRIEGGRAVYAIVGIGVNINPAEHSPEVESIMTSLYDHGVNIEPDEFAKILTEEFFLSLSDVGTENILNEYKSLCSVIGKEVNITDYNGTKTETVTDIDSDFSLITRDEHGIMHRYISGDVSIRQKH